MRDWELVTVTSSASGEGTSFTYIYVYMIWLVSTIYIMFARRDLHDAARAHIVGSVGGSFYTTYHNSKQNIYGKMIYIVICTVRPSVCGL